MHWQKEISFSNQWTTDKKKMCKKDVSWVFAGLFVIRKLAVDIAETVDAWHTK